MLKSRIITAVILLLVLLAALFWLPSSAWAGVCVAMVMVGANEWVKLARLTGVAAWVYQALTLAFMLALAWLVGGHLNAFLPAHFWLYASAAVLWCVIVPCWLIAGWKVHTPLWMAITGWLILLPTGLAMMDLRAYSPWLLLAVMALVWIADSAAYFAGRKFGKHKLAPAISPGKTWEGVAGALLGVSVYMVLLWIGLGRFPFNLSVLVMLPVAWLWVVFSVEGDLFESAIKRQAGVKDSGAILPGHGGLLDRIDALTSALPLAALAMLLLPLML